MRLRLLLALLAALTLVGWALRDRETLRAADRAGAARDAALHPRDREPGDDTRQRNEGPGPPNDPGDEEPGLEPPEIVGAAGALGPLVELRGHIRYDDGVPIAAAEIMLTSSSIPAAHDDPAPQPYAISLAVSDQRGAFRLAFARGGWWRIAVRRLGTPLYFQNEAPAADTLEIVIPREPNALELEFVDLATGAPIVPTKLILSHVAWGPTEIENGLSGRMRRSLSASGWYHLFVTFERHESIARWVEVASAGTTRQRFELGAGQNVRGLVLDDETGAAIPGARASFGSRDGLGSISAITDGEGRFELARLPWRAHVSWGLHIEAEGYSPTVRFIGNVAGHGETESVEVRMQRPAVVTARCVDAGGRPLPSIVVRGQTSPFIGERCTDIVTATATTGADGRVEFELAPGGEELSIACWRRGVRCLDVGRPPLRASERRELGDLVVSDAATLRGVVRASNGRPAPGVTILAEPQRAEDPDHIALANAMFDPKRSAKSDAAGRFQIRGLAPGAWDLLVHGGDHPSLLHEGIAVREGEEPAPVDLRLPEPVALEGRVVDANGRAAAGVHVSWMRLHPVRSSLVEGTTTDEDGRFSIPAFTRADEDVPLWITHGDETLVRKATPRAGPIVIALE